MPDINLQKAIKWNPYYARKTGWTDQHIQVLNVLGFTYICPSEEQFAEAVYHWQLLHPPLKADGVLGPKTWELLENYTQFSTDIYIPLPNWTNKSFPMIIEEESSLKNVWFGLHGNYGGHFVAIGKTSGHAVLFSAEDFSKYFVVTTENWRVGPGLGGSCGISLMIATSLEDPKRLNTHTSDGWDFTLDIGNRWGALAKNLSHAPALKRVVDTIKKANDVAMNPITAQTLKLSADELMKIKGRIKLVVDAMKMKTDDFKPHLLSIGIPIPGTTLELSAFWGFTLFHVH